MPLLALRSDLDCSKIFTIMPPLHNANWATQFILDAIVKLLPENHPVRRIILKELGDWQPRMEEGKLLLGFSQLAQVLGR
jgi:hypothetical protein